MDVELAQYEIKEAMTNPRFQNTVENIFDLDKERYFLILVQQGVKLPTNFDITQLRNTSSEQGYP